MEESVYAETLEPLFFIYRIISCGKMQNTNKIKEFLL